jgi:hypothetical protein
LNQDDCEDQRCYWLEGTQQCVDDPLEFSCDVYTSNETCVEDNYGLGQNGLEARDRCGTYFNAAGEMWGYHNCSCEWNEAAESCDLGYEVMCFIGEDCGGFKCSKDFYIGECVDGVQMINWTAAATDQVNQFDSSTPGFNQAVYDAVLEASCQTNDGTKRSCGVPVVKLPGFSSFSLFAAIGILMAFYYFKKDL